MQMGDLTREFISTVFVMHNEKVLLTWNKKVQTWIPVGGHIEPNEMPSDSVIREAKEESGLDIELFNPYQKFKTENMPQPVHIHLDKIKPDHEHLNLTYFARVKSGELMTQSDEQTPIKFFSKEDLEKENLLPNVKEWALEILKFKQL